MASLSAQDQVCTELKPLRRRHTSSASVNQAVIDNIARALEKKEDYRRMLNLPAREAQEMVDVLQTILDYHRVEPDLRKNIAVALKRLCKKKGCFPSSYILEGIQKRSDGAIANGRFGDVFQGEYNGALVCIKMLRINQREYDEIMKVYAREVIVWGQLTHENVLPFHGICTLDFRPCLISSWAANDTVDQYLKNHPGADRMALVRDMTYGLEYLHGQEIVHGDIKGTNVLVNSEGRACLGDFGLSSIYDPSIPHWTSQSAAASRGGTVRWQAPEVLEETATNTKSSDIYSWACTCYEIFTGEIPYSDIATIYSVYTVKFKNILPTTRSEPTNEWRLARLNDDMWKLLRQCWSSQPEKRPTMNDIRLQLENGDINSQIKAQWNTIQKIVNTQHAWVKLLKNWIIHCVWPIHASGVLLAYILSSSMSLKTGILLLAEPVVLGLLVATIMLQASLRSQREQDTLLLLLTKRQAAT